MSGVSVVIVNWNGMRFLQGCLESLREADEVIVVDNGSSDASVSYIQESWPRVKVVAVGRNAGFSAANNLGMAESSGSFILFLNNDTVVRPGAITTMRSVLERDDRVGAVAPRLEGASGVVQAGSVGELPSLASEARRVFRSATARARWERFDFDRPADVQFATGAALMFPRHVIESIGGWPEEYYFYAEDAEVCRALARQGWRIRFEPAARIVHFHGGSGSRHSTLKALRTQFIGHRSLNLYIRRHEGIVSGGLHWLLYGFDLVLRPWRRLWARRQTADGGRQTTRNGRRQTADDPQRQTADDYPNE